MNCVTKLKNIPSLCRVCLTQSKNMNSLDIGFEETKESHLIIDILEEVIGAKVIWGNEYPTVICRMCLGLLKISYDFRLHFKNSEKLLQRHFKERNIDIKRNRRTKTHSSCNEQSAVEIIVGSNKYNLKDVLIVEEEKQDEIDFRGFLENLGKSVTANFVRKSKCYSKNLHEKPVMLIKKMELQAGEDAKDKNQSMNNLNQYVIQVNDQFDKDCEIKRKRSINSENIDIKNRNCVDQKLVESALNMPLKCNICDKFYSSKERFKKHLQTCRQLQSNANKEDGMLGITSLLKCHLCSRLFKEKKFLNYHMKTAHNPEPVTYKCEICDQILRNQNALMYHKRTKHGARKFVCDTCNKEFVTSNSLKTHIQSHAEQKIAQCICPVCGKTFHYKGGLFYHMKLHTNERKYCCEFCEKKFYTLNAKKRHTLTHTGVRPYPCHYCEKRFFSTGEVRKHEYHHTGVRPYKCQYCKKGFSSSYNMKVHLVSHSGPYACKLCDKTFVTMNILQFHHKIKHSALE